MSQQPQRQKQPSPNRPARPRDVQRHGFGSPEGMELTDVPQQQQPQQQDQQTRPQQHQQSRSRRQPLPPAMTTTSQLTSGGTFSDSTATPQSLAITPVTPTTDVQTSLETGDDSTDNDTPSKPRKRRLFFPPYPRYPPVSSSPSPHRPQQQTATSATYTAPKPRTTRATQSPRVAGTPVFTRLPRDSAGTTSGRPAQGRRRRRPPLSMTPRSRLSGLSTPPRSSRQQQQQSAGRRRSINPLNRISDIFSPQSLTFSQTSLGMTPDQHESSSDDHSSSGASTDSSQSSITEPFIEQVERLNELLTTPAQHLGELGQSDDVIGEEDDDLDSEMKGLESSRKMLEHELSRVEFSYLGGEVPFSSRSPDSRESGINSSTSESSSEARKKAASKYDDSQSDWSPLLPYEASFAPNFSPAMGPQQSSMSRTSPLSATPTYSKKTSPNARAKREDSETGALFGRSSSPFATLPRKNIDWEKKIAPPSAQSRFFADPSPDSTHPLEEDSKPPALKSPPRPASFTPFTETPIGDQSTDTPAQEMKTPDRLTNAGASTHSPSNLPFGREIPLSAPNRTEDTSTAQVARSPDAQPPFSTYDSTAVFSLGMEAGQSRFSSTRASQYVSQSVAAFAEHRGAASRNESLPGQPDIDSQGGMADSSQLLEELDAILAPPIQREEDGEERDIPVVTPENRRAYLRNISREDSSSGISFASTNIPTDERQYLTPIEQQHIRSLTDTQTTAQPDQSPPQIAFGQGLLTTQPNERLGRPPRTPVQSQYSFYARQPTDEIQTDQAACDTRSAAGQGARNVTAAAILPSDASSLYLQSEGLQQYTPFRQDARIQTEDSDDEIMFDIDTPRQKGENVYVVTSPPKSDHTEHDSSPSKTPKSHSTNVTPGTVLAKSYSEEDTNRDDVCISNNLTITRKEYCRRICIACGAIVVILGFSILIGYLLERGSEMTMEPSSTPTLMPTNTRSPTTGLPPTDPAPPTEAPSVVPSAVQSQSPTPFRPVSLTTPYQIFVQNGLVTPVSEDAYIGSLVSAMDSLTYDILANIQNGGRLERYENARNLRRRKLIAVLLPTKVVGVINVTCPVVTERDLCQVVIAEISLVDVGDKLEAFEVTTELAIQIGRLQYYLNVVDPFCPAEVIDSLWKLPAPTPFALPTPTPTVLASHAPSFDPSANPSAEPSVLVATSRPTKTVSLAPTSHQTATPSSESTAFDLLTFLVDNSFDGGTALRIPWSPQGKAYSWLLRDMEGSSYSAQRILQRFAMATLYYSTNGDNWLTSTLWLTPSSECRWFNKASSRATCNSNQELVNLELDLNNLAGSIPAELGLLSSSLERITVRGGPSKYISSTLPPELGYLTRLQVFFVRGNNLSGTIPPNIGSWSEIRQLDLSRNQLAGPIPGTVGNLEKVAFFEVSANLLSGVLPTQMGRMKKCTHMFFEDNRFFSPIPTEFGNLSMIQELKGGSNVLLSLPSELGRLTDATTISFQGSSIPGRIPTEFGKLHQLRFLELRHNVLDDRIPSELGLLVQLRDQLDLSYNRLSGPIPSELGMLSELRGLKLQHNLLSGEIPTELSQLRKLTSVQLEANRLSGTIPSQVCTTFNTTYPSFSTDCEEFTDNCPCCTICCVDGHNCECRYLETPREFLCFQQ